MLVQGDASRPTLLLLPASCHVLAPLRLPPADAPSTSFSIEFGAVLEPGESFGWTGFQPGDESARQRAFVRPALPRGPNEYS